MSSRPASESATPWTRQRVGAPRENGGLLAVPSLREAPAIAEQNRQALSTSMISFLDRPLSELRQAARQEILELTATDSANTPWADSPWFVTGHQPALFHPGVWVKNFATSALATVTHGVGLNLVVDNDVVTSPGILVPAGDRTAPTFAPLLYDTARRAEVWEETHLRDRSLWSSFGTRVREAMQPWGIEPVAPDFWEDVRHCGSTRLVQILTCARAGWERRWAAGNRELPVSKMSETSAFRWFMVHLLQNLSEFHALHNQVLDEYRVMNHVRSRTHPVPDLRIDPTWGQEAPFWAWRPGARTRSRVYARALDNTGRRIELNDGVTANLAILDADPERAVRTMESLARDGWRFRPRALTNTLFARMFLADLFIHGIGGAKYDEMTDQLLARFYGLTPPRFLTLSATLHLPLGREPQSENSELDPTGVLRDIRQHPERFVEADSPGVSRLLKEKAELIAEQQAVTAARNAGQRGVSSRGALRAARLRAITAELADQCIARQEQARADLAAAAKRERANAVLKSREFAYVLFPEDQLRNALATWTQVADERQP